MFRLSKGDLGDKDLFNFLLLTMLKISNVI